LKNGAILLRDDIKSTLETIDAAFDVLAQIPAKRRIVVIGEISEPPGSQGPIYRRLGERIAAVSSKAFFVCTRRVFKSYAGGATAAGFPKDRLLKVGSGGLFRLVEILRAELRAGDVVLLKGRGPQRLERVSYALQGRPVTCSVDHCNAKTIYCETCPIL